MANSTLFGQELPKVILLEDVYDPDVDFGSIENTSKIIPTIGSLLVDGTKVYVVTSVDQITYKTTYRPLSIEESNNLQRIIEYGNTFYSLFFSTVTIVDYTGTSITLTRLAIDDKLVFYGDNVTNYDIVKASSNGNEIIVSRYFNSENKPQGTTCTIAGQTDNKKCVPCYSYDSFKSGESYTLRTYDAAGNLLGRFTLFAVKASMLIELDNDRQPITDVKILSNQIDKDGNIFLYQGQSPSELTLYPVLIDAEGNETFVAIDNTFGFLYGLEEVNTQCSGISFDLLFKYFVSDDIISTLVAGANGNRFISKTFKVHVVERSSSEIAKLSIIPEYVEGNWILSVYSYLTDRSKSPEILKDVSISGFDGTLLNVEQEIKLSATQIMEDATPVNHNQTVYLELRNPIEETVNPFLISDKDESNRVYGDNTPPKVAPMIHFKDGKYFIPENKYIIASPYTSKAEAFIGNFYTEANPPKLEGEAELLMPTHFTIRTTDGINPILPAPIKVEDFEEVLPLIWDVAVDQWVGNTVVVEFWRTSNSDYDILFGVPVRIVAV